MQLSDTEGVRTARDGIPVILSLQSSSNRSRQTKTIHSVMVYPAQNTRSNKFTPGHKTASLQSRAPESANQSTAPTLAVTCKCSGSHRTPWRARFGSGVAAAGSAAGDAEAELACWFPRSTSGSGTRPRACVSSWWRSPPASVAAAATLGSTRCDGRSVEEGVLGAGDFSIWRWSWVLKQG